MQRILLIAVFTLLTTTTFAQYSAGQFGVGGSFSFSSATDDDYYTNTNSTLYEDVKTTRFSLSPKVSYLISDKLMVGGALGISSTKTVWEGSNVDDIEVTDNMLTLTPYARYLGALTEKVGWYGEGFLSIGSGTLDTEGNETSQSFFQMGVRPGMYFFITPKLGLEASWGFFGYEQLTREPDGGEKATYKEFGLSLDLDNFNFGVQYYFGG